MAFKYTLKELKLFPGEDLRERISKFLGIKKSDILSMEVIKRSIDARGKLTKYSYNLKLLLKKPVISRKGLKLEQGWGKTFSFFIGRSKIRKKIIIVGMGPSGIFSSYLLARSGVKHMIIERGKRVDEREKDVSKLIKDGFLNEDSNVLFGEGGAGAFSDGKLTTRIKSPFVELFKKITIEFGVEKETFKNSKPHLGTEGVRRLVKNMREYLLESEVDIHFSEKLVDIAVRDGKVIGIRTNKDEYPCDILILATGHSARDLYELLKKKNIPLEKKIFSVGVRVEHPRDYISKLFYKDNWMEFPPAEYQMAVRLNGRGVYTFCMCPGGYVINASSEKEHLNINGMSFRKRDGFFSNSAIVVNILPEDLGEDPLSGIAFQRYWEKKAYKIKGSFLAPAQNMLDFIENTTGRPISSSYKPGVFEYPIAEVLPRWVVEYLRYGLERFDEKFKGFITDIATIIAPEMRTSSPIRILRNGSGESIGVKGLFPVGEGSGYAGGIVSSAADGMRITAKITSSLEIKEYPVV